MHHHETIYLAHNMYGTFPLYMYKKFVKIAGVNKGMSAANQGTRLSCGTEEVMAVLHVSAIMAVLMACRVLWRWHGSITTKQLSFFRVTSDMACAFAPSIPLSPCTTSVSPTLTCTLHTACIRIHDTGTSGEMSQYLISTTPRFAMSMVDSLSLFSSTATTNARRRRPSIIPDTHARRSSSLRITDSSSGDTHGHLLVA